MGATTQVDNLSSPFVETTAMSKFRNSKGMRLMSSLFLETSYADQSNCVYTLKDEDHRGLPSLYRLYMETEDLTEYEFANKYLDGYEHWTMICESNWFKKYIARWRKELELKIRGRALKVLQEIASDPSHKSASGVNQFLVKGGWKEAAGKGRPSKDDVKKAAKEEADLKSRLEEDFALLHPDRDKIDDAKEKPQSVH